jgi:hypothetical protein
LELQALGARTRTIVLLAAAAAACLLAAVAPQRAAAAGTVTKTVTVTTPGTPVLVTSQNTPPAGYRLTASKVERIAAADPRIKAELHRHPRATPYEYTKGDGLWQVSWFSASRHAVELAQVYVSDATGLVTEAWTGFQVAWTMARGYPGAFGHRVNALYVWIPMCLLFVAPFIPWRRGVSLLHLDLLMMLGFSISLALFNNAQIGLSVPLVYPFLIYLLVRLLLLAFGRGRPRRPLPLLVPASWLAVAVMFLVGFRIGLNVTNSNVIDVGYAGPIGADLLIHGHSLYGHWPTNSAQSDTYGPVNYYAYVPFRAAFDGSLLDPAAHAAAIAFDLLTLVGLFLLGRRIRGPTLGVILAYAWASYPFTLWSLESNVNDGLVAFLVVAALLVVRWAPARGIAGALAGMTKFAPLALGPLLLRGEGAGWPRKRSLALYVGVYLVTLAVVMLPVLLDNNISTFWHDTIVYQSNRITPFSVWGLWGGLSLERHLVEGAAIGLAILVAFVPRRRGLVEIAALGGAVLIALQLAVGYWLYSYVVWFFPLVAVALLGAFPRGQEEPVTVRAPAPAQLRSPALAQTR